MQNWNWQIVPGIKALNVSPMKEMITIHYILKGLILLYWNVSKRKHTHWSKKKFLFLSTIVFATDWINGFSTQNILYQI